MKKCIKCGDTKKYSDFNKCKSFKDGFNCYCRECIKKMYGYKYRTLEGCIYKIYNSQIYSSEKRGHEMPTYTKQELKEWLFKNNYKNIHYNWVMSGYKKDFVPSIDRIDNYKGYSFDNIQLLTFKENREKYYKDAKNGKNTKMSKIVLQFDLNGTLVREWYSTKEAGRNGYLSSKVADCCRGEIKFHRGSLWEYKKVNEIFGIKED